MNKTLKIGVEEPSDQPNSRLAQLTWHPQPTPNDTSITNISPFVGAPIQEGTNTDTETIYLICYKSCLSLRVANETDRGMAANNVKWDLIKHASNHTLHSDYVDQCIVSQCTPQGPAQGTVTVTCPICGGALMGSASSASYAAATSGVWTWVEEVPSKELRTSDARSFFADFDSLEGILDGEDEFPGFEDDVDVSDMGVEAGTAASPDTWTELEIMDGR